MHKIVLRVVVFSMGLIALLVTFQNCGEGFKAHQNLSSSSQVPEGLDQGEDGNLIPPKDPVIDPNGSLAVYLHNSEVIQGDFLSFKVELNQKSSTPVTVDLKTIDATAQVVTHYHPLSKTSVTIPPGETSIVVELPTRVPQVATVDRTMALVVTKVSEGEIGQSTAVGTIKATAQVVKAKAISYWGYYIDMDGNLKRVRRINRGRGLEAQKVYLSDAIAADASYTHYNNGERVCAVNKEGEVYCWGGAIYSGTIIVDDRKSPTLVTGIKDVVDVNVELNHNCALTAQKQVWCWGANYSGQLGNGTYEASPTPVKVKNLTNVTALSKSLAPARHTCAVTEGKKVWCWGNDDTTYPFGSSNLPVEVPGLSGVVSVTHASYETCALHEDGQVSCWSNLLSNNGLVGPYTVENLPIMKSVQQKRSETCGISQKGRVLCWKELDASDVAEVEGLGGAVKAFDDRGCYIMADNSLKCTSLTSTTVDFTEIPIEKPQMQGAQSVAEAGDNLDLASLLTDDGQVKKNRRFVDGSALKSISGMPEATAMDMTYAVTCAIAKADGQVWCDGHNQYNMLGSPEVPENRSSDSPVKAVVPPAQAIVAGYRHLCALTQVGKVYCWGGYTHDGGNLEGHLPYELSGLSEVISLSTEGRNTCAVTTAGEVYCWGRGFLIDGMRYSTKMGERIKIANIPKVQSVSVGYSKTCGLTSAGEVYCWGFSLNAKKVEGLKDIEHISVSGFKLCASTAQGHVYCQYKDEEPQLVARMPGLEHIRVDRPHTCLFSKTGDVRCMGNTKNFGRTEGAFHVVEPRSF